MSGPGVREERGQHIHSREETVQRLVSPGVEDHRTNYLMYILRREQLGVILGAFSHAGGRGLIGKLIKGNLLAPS